MILAFKASVLAEKGDRDLALVALEESLDAGYRDHAALRTNRSLDQLREDPRHADLLHRLALQR